MRARLEGPDAVVRPSAQDRASGTFQVKPRQLVNVVHNQAVPDVIDRVAAIQTRVRVCCRITLASGGAIRGSRTAVPGRAVIDRVAVGVVDVEEQATRHLMLDRGLQRVVIGVDRIFPNTQLEVVRIQAATQTQPRYAEVVGSYDACGKLSSG